MYFHDKLDEFYGKIEDEGEVRVPYQLKPAGIWHQGSRSKALCCCSLDGMAPQQETT